MIHGMEPRRTTVTRRTLRAPTGAAVGVLPFLLLGVVPLPSSATGASPSEPASSAAPAVTACADARLSVVGGDASDVADACAGGLAAIAFLARQGLDVRQPLRVEIVERMPPGYAEDAAGFFDPASNRVLLLDYPGFARFGAWLGRPIDRAIHRAIAAHEVAHALSASHFVMPRPPRIAGEYIAYVTMFATMDPALRELALTLNPEPAWADDDVPDVAEYLSEPMRFGARAWRHWSRQSDPPAFLRAVLGGRALDSPRRRP